MTHTRALVLAGALALVSACGSGTASNDTSGANSQSELWKASKAKFKASGSGTIADKIETPKCDDLPHGVTQACGNFGRVIEDHSTYTLEPISVSYVHTLTTSDDPTHHLTASVIITGDGVGYQKLDLPHFPQACWNKGDSKAISWMVGTPESPLPPGIQVLLAAEVSSKDDAPNLPGELIGTAPAALVVSFLNPMVSTSIRMPSGIKVPVHLRVGAQGTVLGLSARGKEVFKAIQADPLAGSVDWGEDGNQILLLATDSSLDVNDLGAAPAVVPPPSSEVCPPHK